MQLVAYRANSSPANRIFMPIKMEMTFPYHPIMYSYINNDEETGDICPLTCVKDETS